MGMTKINKQKKSPSKIKNIQKKMRKEKCRFINQSSKRGQSPNGIIASFSDQTPKQASKALMCVRPIYFLKTSICKFCLVLLSLLFGFALF